MLFSCISRFGYRFVRLLSIKSALHMGPASQLGDRAVAVSRTMAHQWLMSSQAGWSEHLLRFGPHLTVLAIVLAVVLGAGDQHPAAAFEETLGPSQEHRARPPIVRSLDESEATLSSSFLVRPMDPAPVLRENMQPAYRLRTYVVQPGDTIWDIGERAGVGMWPVLWTNELESDQTLRPGQELRIPPVPGAGRTVQQGDTTESIAQRFKVDTRIVVISNNLSPGVEPVVGTYLFVPGGQLPIPELIPGHATGKFGWPARGRISSNYTGWHPGIDIAVDYGVPIYAADGGIVVSASWDQRGYGNRLVLDHRNGFLTTYSHLSRFYVRGGQLVQKGGMIGLNGSTGNSTGPHLHFEIIRNGYHSNPLQFLR